MSQSQLGQDLNVIKFYNNKKNGYFIEIGANDGINLSNTYLLEFGYEWYGICVEPIPYNYEKLCLNRPNSICVNKAVYSKSDLILQFDICNHYDLLSGISDHIDSLHKSNVDSNKTIIHVNTITLLELLDNNNAPKFIDYMSLDTEGSEYEILKIFDFNKYIFGLIDIEHNYVEPRRTNIRNLLIQNGYVYIGEKQWDDQYKHSSQI